MTTQTIVREHEADLVVQEALIVADGVVALTLADPNGGELPPWTPGAHIDFVLGDELIRQYSLCSSPSKPNVWRVGVLRAPDSRGGSEQVHDILAPGSIVRVRVRATTFHWSRARGTSSLLAASGSRRSCR